MGQQNTKSVISIKIISSETQSNELFDFHHKGIQHEEKLINSLTYLVNDGETWKLIDQQSLISPQCNVPDNAIYKIQHDECQQIKIQHLGRQQDKILWRVLRQGEAYGMRVGDRVKIGKLKFELKNVTVSKKQVTPEEATQNDIIASPLLKRGNMSIHSNLSEGNKCRICFQGESKKSDPLLCLCKCSGSIKFTHFLCLEDWINNRIQKRQEESFKFFSYQQTCCELCKQILPTIFKHQDREYTFFEHKFQPPYVQFESVEEGDSGKRIFHKYIIKLQEHKEILMGRNNNCQVVMKDVSVSRAHCSVELKQGTLFLRDKKSKFGTLIKIDRPLEFNMENGLRLQFQSLVMEFHRKHKLKGCCCSDSDHFRLVYQIGEKETRKPQQSYLNQGNNQEQVDSVPFQELQFGENVNQERNRENQFNSCQKKNQLAQTRGQSFISSRSTIMRATMTRDETGRP